MKKLKVRNDGWHNQPMNIVLFKCKCETVKEEQK